MRKELVSRVFVTYTVNRDLRFSWLMQSQVEVCWVVTLCSVVVGYQRFGGPCCLHLQGEDIDLKYSDQHPSLLGLLSVRTEHLCVAVTLYACIL
jgi:hypothetical protein